MAVIRSLPENVINQIAAGEVVERPASAVKELIENAVDAHAHIIRITIGGELPDEITIVDDGDGMDQTDAQACFGRHATSKLTTIDDLFSIGSFGFRGEALASIAAIAQIALRTKQRDALSGTEVVIHGGVIKNSTDIGCAAGTKITISNLFYNTPARRKFLKNDRTEFQHVLEVVTQFALAFPSIHFTLIHHQKTVLSCPPAPNLQIRIGQILGTDLATELLPVFYGSSAVGITGFIGKPAVAKSSRRFQYLFINQRPVVNPFVQRAILDAFSSMIPPRTYPVVILNLTIPPADVDVNVHPRKLEVRFRDGATVYKSVHLAVKGALDKFLLAPNVSLPKLSSVGGALSHPVPQTIPPLHLEAVQELFAQEKQGIASVSNAAKPVMVAELVLTAIGQINNAYIIGQSAEGIAIIDQHAAHERVLTNLLKKRFTQTQKQTQPLLVPITLHLSAKDSALLTANQETFRTLGFAIELFGAENRFIVQEVPAGIFNGQWENLFHKILDDLHNDRTPSVTLSDKVIFSMACRSAVMFGDPLDQQAQQHLLDQLFQTEDRGACPHGRPTMIVLTFNELLRQFKRT